MSVFFFDYVDAPNHLAGPPDDERIPAEVLGRALVVEQLELLLIVAGLDLIVTGGTGHCPLYKKLGRLPLRKGHPS